MPETFAHVLESLREPGTSLLSAARVAALLELQQQDLAALADVHHNTVRTHPESARVQAALRDLVRVLSAASAIQPDLQRVARFIKNESIVSLGHKTLLDMVRLGRVDDAIAYLESVACGFAG